MQHNRARSPLFCRDGQPHALVAGRLRCVGWPLPCVLAAALVLLGCATGPAFTSVEPPRAGNAAVFVYRTSSLFGAGVKHEVFVNATRQGVMVNGGYMRLVVPPGDATVRAQGCEPPVAPMALAQGQVGYVQLELTNKTFELSGRYYFDYGCLLVRRTEAEALATLPGLRLLVD